MRRFLLCFASFHHHPPVSKRCFFFLPFRSFFNIGKQTSNRFICMLELPQTNFPYLLVCVVEAPTLLSVFAGARTFAQPCWSLSPRATDTVEDTVHASRSLWLETKSTFFQMSICLCCNWSTMCGLLAVTLHPHTCARTQASRRLLIDKSAGYCLTPNLLGGSRFSRCSCHSQKVESCKEMRPMFLQSD